MLPLLVAAAGVAKAGLSIYAGQKASTEAKYNAKLKDEQAKMVEQQMGISGLQWDRTISRAMSTTVQRSAASGLEFSGSPVAVMLDTVTQMEFDKAIDIWNLEWQKRGIESEASAYRRQSKYVKQQGYLNAFSSLLSAGSDYASMTAKYPTG